MRIVHFRIENFRNIRLAECHNPPDFMVICGGNGCGKSAILSALMTAKEHTGHYGNFQFDPKVVSADASEATISMTLEFTDNERTFVKNQFSENCPEREEIVVRINKSGNLNQLQRSSAAYHLLSSYSRNDLNSPGFFDYIDAHRQVHKIQLSNWDSSAVSEERTKQTLSSLGTQKFQYTKEYLASLKMKDIQDWQKSFREGNPVYSDSLQDIRDFFDQFFSPMKFVDVHIDTSPFKFIISTPRGEIDIDDLSSGEKEILNNYIRFHQLKPQDAVILFDEADAHLHPDLERRYLQVLREVGKGNQLWITTHSPEMMIAAGSDALYTVLKEPLNDGGNQLVRVTESDHLHHVLSEVMGSRGLVSFNQRIIFIEGEDASADREIYEAAYPPGLYNISFVPASDSATVRKTAERVNELLTTSMGFQQYFSIVDGDIERPEADPTNGQRLFRLPVYHVENFLLNDNEILEATRALLGKKCPYNSEADISECLKKLLLSDSHLKPYTKALLDAQVAKLAKDIKDAVFQGKVEDIKQIELPDFVKTEVQAKHKLESAIANNTWHEQCKGRDLLKAYCREHGFRYEQFRNLLIDKMKTPPQALDEIMNRILSYK